MNHYTEARVTLTIAGNEQDVNVRALVRVEHGHDGVMVASLADAPDVWWAREWVDIDDPEFRLSIADRAHIARALEEAALDDTSDDGREWDDLDEMEDA